MTSLKAALAAAIACGSLLAQAAGPGKASDAVHSRADGRGTVAYWGDGAHYEITGPGVTVFFLERDNGSVVDPLVRVSYVGAGWINVRAVTITVGERTFGPYEDAFGKPSRVEAERGLVVESLVFKVDSDEKWQMLEGVGEASDLGRPVIAVFEADAPYGIELDRATKQATGHIVKAFGALAARMH